jgi:hypothetical protein
MIYYNKNLYKNLNIINKLFDTRPIFIERHVYANEWNIDNFSILIYDKIKIWITENWDQPFTFLKNTPIHPVLLQVSLSPDFTPTVNNIKYYVSMDNHVAAKDIIVHMTNHETINRNGFFDTVARKKIYNGNESYILLPLGWYYRDKEQYYYPHLLV